MPQMMPMMWLYMYMFIFLYMITLISLTYFISYPLLDYKIPNIKYLTSMKWNWKW